jgi:hypothetical protein
MVVSIVGRPEQQNWNYRTTYGVCCLELRPSQSWEDISSWQVTSLWFGLGEATDSRLAFRLLYGCLLLNFCRDDEDQS